MGRAESTGRRFRDLRPCFVGILEFKMYGILRCQLSDHFTGVPSSQNMRGYAMGNDTSGTNDTAGANGYIGQDNNIAGNPDMIFYCYRQGIFNSINIIVIMRLHHSLFREKRVHSSDHSYIWTNKNIFTN